MKATACLPRWIVRRKGRVICVSLKGMRKSDVIVRMCTPKA